MFCIDNRCTDIYFNLAAEEYLLKQKRGNFFMLWQSEPSVVIGKHQSVAAEADERFLDEKGITLARRFSGGGAVYHDRGNINLSFIETVKQPDFVYYLQQVVDFLEKVGISAYADQRLGIYVDERKISGSAQCIHKDRVMYHCTLLFSTDLDTLNAALNGDPDAESQTAGRILADCHRPTYTFRQLSAQDRGTGDQAGDGDRGDCLKPGSYSGICHRS